MGAARRSCVRAVVLAAILSAVVGAMLPGCRFPNYGMVSKSGGNAGAPTSGGSAGDPVGGTAGESGEAGSDAGAGTAAGAGGAAGMEEPVKPCEQTCVPGPPTGWQGPMALWEAQASAASAPPSCPKGFSDPAPIDVHHGLVAPDGACTCICAPAEGQVCDANLRIHLDQTCSEAGKCATVATRACTAVPAACTGSQGSASLDAATISGGSCKGTPTKPDPAAWQYNDRLCHGSDTGSCEDPKQVCARTPTFPYLSPLCITRVIGAGQTPPACPEAYKNAIVPLYETFDDTRGCTDCTCGPPVGGSCSGSAVLSSSNSADCSGTVTIALGTNCKAFDLGPGAGVHPTHVGGQYTVTPGMCGVATQAAPKGECKETGKISVVCCQ